MTVTAGGGGRVVLAADEVERLMLARMDLDRYEAEVIPDLNERVRDLALALTALAAAAEDPARGGLEEAVVRARRVLAAR